MTHENQSGEFVGDSKYLNDGGSSLQKLWEVWSWSEIKNCPGRYVTKHNIHATTISPDDLLQSLNIHCLLNEYHVDNKDTIVIGAFQDGGGLLTYVKNDGRYVHTLNTRSGLLRKITSLGLDLPM
jgi:hypothetical protein